MLIAFHRSFSNEIHKKIVRKYLGGFFLNTNFAVFLEQKQH